MPSRRAVVAGSLAAALSGGRAASAQTWPSRPVRIVVPFAPGGTSDILARLIQVRLSEALGQPVVVENKPGANGNIGLDLVAKSPPDGHTLGLSDLGNLAISPSLYKLPFDLRADFAPVTVLSYSPHLLAVRPDFPAASVAEFVAYARAHPGRLNNATAGFGSAPHLASLSFANALGLKWVDIPTKGGAEAILQVAAGQADFLFNGMLATLPHVRSGKLRLLAVSSGRRIAELPDAPTVSEATGLADFVTGSWQGVLAPAGTPAAILDRLHAEISKIVDSGETRERLKAAGADPTLFPPARSKEWLAAEQTRWAELVRATGFKIE